MTTYNNRADIVSALQNGETVSVGFRKLNGEWRDMRATGVKEQPEVCTRLGRTLVLENINGIASYRQVCNRTVKAAKRLRPFDVYFEREGRVIESAYADTVWASNSIKANKLAEELFDETLHGREPKGGLDWNVVEMYEGISGDEVIQYHVTEAK